MECSLQGNNTIHLSVVCPRKQMKTGAGIPPGTTSEGPSQTSPETMAFPVTYGGFRFQLSLKPIQ